MNKNEENLSEEERIMLGIEAIKSFFDQLGEPNDVYKEIFLTVLFEELMGRED
jgi:hypothetical protein